MFHKCVILSSQRNSAYIGTLRWKYLAQPQNAWRGENDGLRGIWDIWRI